MVSIFQMPHYAPTCTEGHGRLSSSLILTFDPQLFHLSTLKSVTKGLICVILYIHKSGGKSDETHCDRLWKHQTPSIQWVLSGYGSLRGTHSGCVWGFKPVAAVYCRGAVCLVGPYWLLAIRRLLWPERFVTSNARSKGRMRRWWLMRSHSPRGAESSPGKRGFATNEQCADLRARVSRVFPRLAYCNEAAAASSRISSVQFRRSRCSA